MTRIPPRRWRSVWIAALLGLGLSGAAITTPTAAAATPPTEDWAQQHGDLPVDPAVRFGVLPNGLRYAIMKNATPKGEVSVRFRIGVGSLDETDGQQGLAHFVEHMSFRGSTHVPQAEEWKSLQRMGMALGADVSAFTSQTQTFYQFDLPNADLGAVDTALMRMREVASELNLRPDAMDAERGTILAEERSRDTPGMRSTKATLGFFYQGQPLASRLPIGTVDNIEHAQAAQLRAFYRAYYRPERAVLIVVGDVDPATIEAKIKAHFADWTPVGPPGPEANPGTPAPRGQTARLVVDASGSRSILVAWMSPYRGSPKTVAGVSDILVQNIGLTILNRRLQAQASRTDRPFLAAQVSRQDQSRSARVTMLSVDIDPLHWKGALQAAELTRRQAVQYGVSQDEVDREVAVLRASYQSAASGAATRPTPALANALLAAADQIAVFTSPAENQSLVESVTKELKADRVTSALREAFQGQGPLIFISSPTPIDGGEAVVTAAFTEAESEPIAVRAADAKLEWPYANFGPPGKVVDQRTVADLGVTLARFANGVRLTVKPTSFSAGQVLVAVNIGDGLSGTPKDRSTARWADDSGGFLLGGLKALSYEDMQRVLASKVYTLGFGSREDGFVLSGATRPSDIDTQLQVLAAYLTAPGWRPEAFDRVRAGAAPLLNTFASSPAGVLQRDLGFLLHDGDPRWATETALDVNFGRFEDMKAVLETPLAQAPIEVTIVGDIAVDRAVSAVAATFGALPPRPPPVSPSAEELQTRFPAPTPQPVTLYHKGRDDQALALIAWPSADFYSAPKRSRDLRVLEQIIQARLFEQLRVVDGASYVPQTNLETSLVFPGYGYIDAYAEVPPGKTGLFFDTMSKIAADLRAGEVSRDELERARDPRVDLFTKSQQTNAYWLNVLIGVHKDPRKLDVVRTTIPDLQHVSAADVQRAAQAYLVDERAWRLIVLPRSLAPAQPPAPVNGVAVVNCAVTERKLSDCRVVREDPAGRGLGAEAVAVAAKVNLDPNHEVKIVDGRAQIGMHLPVPPLGN